MNVRDGIQNLQQVLGVSGAGSVSDARKLQSQASDTATVGMDRANVSTAASLANQAMAVPDVRMDKVAAVQQSLASGSYQVSSEDVADKLMVSLLVK